MDNQPPASPFWTFSLRLYGRPGVPQACLKLQDGAGVDVNVLLFLLFAASSGRAIDRRGVDALKSAMSAWTAHVVIPLRETRRALKEPPSSVEPGLAAALRERIKAVELEAERIQQETLFARFPMAAFPTAGEAPSRAARSHVATYAGALGGSFDRAASETILNAFVQLQDLPS